MPINERAASNALRLLIGDQGCQAFTMIYQALDEAEKAGEARGHKTGLVKGWEEGKERDFRDGWNAGWAAREREERRVVDDTGDYVVSRFDDDAHLLDEDFDEEYPSDFDKAAESYRT